MPAVFLARLATRNVVRRPARTLTMVAGMALSVTLVTAALGLGDSLDASARAALARDFGQMTGTVSGHFSAPRGQAARQWLAGRPGVTAATAFALSPAALIITSGRTGLSRQSVSAVGVQPDFSSTFGSARTQSGGAVDLGTLSSGRVAVSASLAHTYEVTVGDRLLVDFFGQERTVTVAAILDSDIASTATDLLLGGLAQVVMSMNDYAALTDSGGVVTILAYRAPRLSAAGSAALTAAVREHFGISAGFRPAGPGEHPVQVVSPQLTLASAARQAAGRASFLGALGTGQYKQLSQLLPSLTVLLIGCGIALLLLMVVLLTAERRIESGVARAIGLSRSWLAGSCLIEGVAYAAAGIALGIPAGIALISLEIAELARLPLSTPFGGGFHLSLATSVSGRSIVIVASSVICLIAALMLLASVLTARDDIVASVRGLPDPPRARGLAGVAWRCGAIPALGAIACLAAAARLQAGWEAVIPARLRGAATFDAFWVRQLGVFLAFVAAGLAATFVLRAARIPPPVAARAGTTLAAACCLVYALQPDGTVFSLFQPPGASFLISASAGHLDGQVWSLVLGDLMLIGGAVAVVVANIDFVTAALRRVTAPARRAVPSVRVACAYLLAIKFRSLATVSVTALVMFLTVLILTVDGSVAAASLDATASGGYQLSAEPAPGSSTATDDVTRLPDLGTTVASAATLTMASGGAVTAMTADLPGRKPQPLADQLTAADRSFARGNDLNLSVAAGYPSARAVWDAVENGGSAGHPAPAVWRFEPGVTGIDPRRPGFAPFSVTVTSAAGQVTTTLLVIAVAPATSRWAALFTGPAAFHRIAPHAGTRQTLFRLASGTSPAAAIRALADRLGPRGLQVQSLVSDQAAGAAATTAVLLTGYLALGWLFGALALSVVTSRSVLERRPHLGMLRAAGLSTTGLLLALLTEIGLQVVLSLTVGVAMALWAAHRILAALTPAVSTPWAAIAAMGGSCLTLTVIAVALPVRRAVAISPAQATQSL
ncbi:MAG: ABC transporter permease [Streptosporangiaceae bacterium]|nr:ABC transporter permease [Streptosporangiaceae bacterium]MBV9854049.1 ABC transporter permease [Streptosporangiaceae bacterium]